MLNRLICLILGYFIGAIIQTGFWIGKFNHIDIRDYGSGNAGTTNTMRTLGKKAGFITYFMDAFKSCITAIIIHFIYGSNSDISEMLLILYGGFGVVLGHNFPFYLGFKGGKGVATSLGVLLMTNWQIGLICLVFALVLMALSKMVSLGSVGAAILFPVLVLFIHTNFTVSEGSSYLIYSIILAVIVAFNHRSNIKRILNGTENKLSFKK